MKTTNLNAANNAKVKNHLASAIRYCNRSMCVDTWLIELSCEGYKPEIKQVPKYEFNRTKYNRMDGREQAEYEKKLKETKEQYIATNGDHTIYLNKIEFDYLTYLTTTQ